MAHPQVSISRSDRQGGATRQLTSRVRATTTDLFSDREETRISYPVTRQIRLPSRAECRSAASEGTRGTPNTARNGDGRVYLELQVDPHAARRVKRIRGKRSDKD